MSKRLEAISDELAEWIAQQKIFFVASAPLSAQGHVNCSPEGGDSFRILGPHSAAYTDYTGSGAETAAHLMENGRITIMFCSFTGPPRIVRLHGCGKAVLPCDPAFASLAGAFPSHPGIRAIIRIGVERVSTSCGYAVPFFDHQGPRKTLEDWAGAKGEAGLQAYRAEKNRISLDGLPSLAHEAPGGNLPLTS
ncbi:MAG: pyridoxamine 5'-phosphate oxidase family protein [Verrucomicrobia bacterium]|nr:pyridoxamine 5'-phosphate oxidase family protein [Verrucomicrobiota bacterium]